MKYYKLSIGFIQKSKQKWCPFWLTWHLYSIQWPSFSVCIKFTDHRDQRYFLEDKKDQQELMSLRGETLKAKQTSGEEGISDEWDPVGRHTVYLKIEINLFT